MKRWKFTVVGLVLVAIAACVVVNSRSFRIRYHLHRMQAAHDAIYAEPSVVASEGLVGYGSQDLFDRHEYHRDRLVELGYYFHATYQMENIPDSEEGVHSALWGLVMANFPDTRHPELSYPDNVLEVWDLSTCRADWDAFVKKHDVSDFTDRFMDDAGTKANQYVAAWPELGMWLPNHEEVAFFKANMTDVRDVLARALRNENPDIRQAAAYVIEEIGPEARHFGTDVMDQLRKEQSRFIRLYLYGALGGIRFDDADAIRELRRRYSLLDDTNVPQTDDYEYAAADEKIVIASVLFVLDSSNDRSDYLSYIILWLKPPPADATPAALSGYSQRRLCATNCLETMPNAAQVVPALEAMLAHPNAENWVRFRVPRLLKKLRSIDAPKQSVQ